MLKKCYLVVMLCLIGSVMTTQDAQAEDLADYGYYVQGGDCPSGYRKVGPNCYNSATGNTLRATTPDTIDPLLKSMQPDIYAKLEADYAKVQKNNDNATNNSSAANTQKQQNAVKDCSSVTCGAGEALNPADCSCVKTKSDTASEILDKYSVQNTAPPKFDSVYDKVENNGSSSSNSTGDGSAQGGAGATAQGGASTTSGYVSQVEDVAQGVSDDFGMGECKEGSIFKQLACRAGFIGDGLRRVAYIIAGLALIVFSFAAIFGKVKWPVFCTIMFCCFLLSAIVFVVNTMTAKENSAAWIGGINDDGSVVSYQSTNEEMAANQNVDASGKQFSDEERPQ